MHETQTDSVFPRPVAPTSSAPAPLAWYARLFETVRALLLSVRIRHRVRSLQLCEALPLGEKRLLAVVQFEGRRFLIGATQQSISLLDKLDSPSAPLLNRDRSAESSYLSGVH